VTFDSGTKSNFVSMKVLRELGLGKDRFEQNSHSWTTFSGEQMTTRNEIVLEWRTEKDPSSVFRTRCIVVEGESAPFELLLGRDFINKPS
jgi:hypothetical protein